MDLFYDLELALEEGRIRSRFNDRLIGDTPCGQRTAGSVFLYSHAGFTFEIDQLELEGIMVPASTDRLRAEWVEAKLVKAGL